MQLLHPNRWLTLVSLIIVGWLMSSGFHQSTSIHAAPHGQSRAISALQTSMDSCKNFVVLNQNGFEPESMTIEQNQCVTWQNVTTATVTLQLGLPDPEPTITLVYLPLLLRDGGDSQRTVPTTTSPETVQLPQLTSKQTTVLGSLAPNQTLSHTFAKQGNVDIYWVETGETSQITVQERQLTSIARTSPLPGEGDVAVTRESFIEFSHPLASSEVPSGAVSAQFAGQTLPTRLHLSPDKQRLTIFYTNKLPANARVRLTIQGDSLLDETNTAVDVDGDGTPSGTTTLDFDTLTLSTLPGTRVCGRVFASELATTDSGKSVDDPLQGATITVDGMADTLRTTTDSTGNFCLDPAPVGRFFVHIDGRTARNLSRQAERIVAKQLASE